MYISSYKQLKSLIYNLIIEEVFLNIYTYKITVDTHLHKCGNA
jgi:hypothetical protein